MSPILLAVQLIQRQADGRFARELQIIDRQTRQMDRLVEDLLDAARVACGRIELNRAPIKLRDILDRVVEMLAPQMEERKQRVSMQVADDLTVLGDEPRLTRVFASVLGNALRNGDSGAFVAIRGFSDADHQVVEIQGTGARLPQQMQVGAALVEGIVDLHGGEVSVELAGQATRAVVRLPGVREDAPPAAAAPTRVLIVDDNVDGADVMAMALRGRGYAAHVAYDGAQALAAAQAFRPDVVLVDIGLPDMDGYELAARIRSALGADSRVKLIALTGFTPTEDDKPAALVEFSEYFVKPVDVATIDVTVKRLLGQGA